MVFRIRQGSGQPANLDLLVERLEQAETHEPEAERQDQIRDEEGDAQGRGMLRVFLQPFDLAPAVVGDGGRQDEEQHLDQTLRFTIAFDFDGIRELLK